VKMLQRWIIAAIVLMAVSFPALAESVATEYAGKSPATPPTPVMSVSTPSAGLAVDRNGGPTIDPTENVKALTSAGLGRQDDLRNIVVQLIQAKMDAVKEIGELKYQHSLAMLLAAQNQLESEVKLRAELAKDNAEAEKQRLNAIRAVDVQAVSDQARRTAEQATTLQAQTAQLAEALRTQTSRLADDLRTLVTTTATTQQANQQQKDQEVSKRLTTVEQALSEGRGKQQFQDPAIIALSAAVERLNQQRAVTNGTDTGQSNVVFYLFGGLTLALAAAALFMRRVPPAPPPNNPPHQ
jgi:hypothetical protein